MSGPDTRSPYRGLTPYQEADAPYFFGRTVDIGLVIANLLASRLTLLYGASGVGKSSLLNAGVIPQLRTVAENSRRQFEKPEIGVVVFRDWTHGPARALTAAVRETCAEAVGQPVGQPQTGGLLSALRDGSIQVGGDVLVVLDQFEEHFLYNTVTDDSEDFDQAFVSALNDPALRANFLISIREDAIAKLDQFKGRIPKLFDNYLRIHHLNEAAGKEAIEGPVAEYNRRCRTGLPPVAVEDGFVTAVLSDVRMGRVTINDDAVGVVAGAATSDDGIETPFLQLVMTRVWDAEIGTGSLELRRRTFLETLGGARNIVQSHVREALKSLTPDESRLAVAAFRYLITPSHTKIALRAADLAAIADLPPQPVAELLEKLTGSGYRILKPIPPPPDHPAAVSYEIWHDVLAQAILDWRAEQVRAADVEAARARSDAELQAAKQRAQEREATARRARRVTLVVSICLLLSLVAGAYGWHEARVAQDEARNTRWRKLVDDARLAMPSDPELSVLLARQALRETLDAKSPIAVEVADALSQALGVSRVRQTLKTEAAKTPHLSRVGAVSDGVIAVLGADDQIFLIDVNNRTQRKLPAPSAKVVDMAVSHDGSRVALALEDKTVQILDVGTGHSQKGIALSDKPSAIAWSPDGRLAVSTLDGRVTLWAASGEAVREIARMDDRQYYEALDFSPDGQRLAGAGTDKSVRVWTTMDGRERGHTCAANDEVSTVRFAPDGKLLATAGLDQTVLLWSLDDVSSAKGCAAKPVRTLVGHHNSVFDVQFSHDGKTLASASADTTVRLWTVDTGGVQLTLVGHREPVERLAFVTDDELASASWDGTTRVWDVTGWANVFVAGETAGGGARMVTLSRDGRAAVLDTDTGDIYRHAFLPDSSQVSLDGKGERVAQARHGSVELWNLADNRRISAWSAAAGEVTALTVSPDGQLVATGDDGGFTRVWDVASKQKIFETSHPYVVRLLEFSRDGRWLVSSDEGGGIKVWERSTKRVLERKEHTRSLSAIAWSADGRWMATGGQDSITQIWSVPAFKVEHTLKHANMVFGVDFSPDSRQLLAIGADNLGRRFDLASGVEISPPLSGHTGWIAMGRYSPDGRLIATVSWDHTARLWDAKSGQQLATYLHDDQLRLLTFSPDSHALMTVSEGAQVRYIPIDPNQLAHLADDRVTRPLTAVECRVYLGSETCPGTGVARR